MSRQMSPVMAGGERDNDHRKGPVAITFTKWGAPPPAMPPTPFFGLFEGFSGDGLLGSFVAEVLWRQRSVNGHVTGLEAMYEVVDGDRSFSALIRGGTNAAGAGAPHGTEPAARTTRAAVPPRVAPGQPSPSAPARLQLLEPVFDHDHAGRCRVRVRRRCL